MRFVSCPELYEELAVSILSILRNTDPTRAPRTYIFFAQEEIENGRIVRDTVVVQGPCHYQKTNY